MKRLIIYYENKTGKELCRDNECFFEPHFGDIVDLTEFPLTNTLNSDDGFGIKWNVLNREINNGILKVYLNKLEL
tara:strand:- start:1767 stop:1991 length:225 start_codon:yes stop_codon:yes gene_type:complete